MKDAENTPVVFISYAWGGAFGEKEWIRRNIVEGLNWQYRVFWDRDSIGFGESIDACIAKALGQRPLTVFCICDADYLASARIAGSGLSRELHMLSEIAGTEQVRIIPLLIEEGCAGRLPAPLAGLAYLDLTEPHKRGLYLGDIMYALMNGATQAEMNVALTRQIQWDDLNNRANRYFRENPFSIRGNARTHEVTTGPGQLLPAPQWMWDSDEWGYMLGDDNPTYCPSKGRWHWDYFTPSRGMRALGTAVMAFLFPHRTGPADQRALQAAGTVLAQRIFAMTYITEPFNLEPGELVCVLLNDNEGYAALASLLETPGRPPA